MQGAYLPEVVHRIKKHLRIAFHKEYGRYPDAVHIVGGPVAYQLIDGESSSKIELSKFVNDHVKKCCVRKHRYVFVLSKPIYANRDNDKGPAVLWPNGEKQYCIKDRSVPEIMVMRKHRICIRHIKQASNAEIKRLMIEAYTEHHGHEKFIKGMNATLIHEGERGKLWGIIDNLNNDRGFAGFEMAARVGTSIAAVGRGNSHAGSPGNAGAGAVVRPLNSSEMRAQMEIETIEHARLRDLEHLRVRMEHARHDLMREMTIRTAVPRESMISPREFWNGMDFDGSPYTYTIAEVTNSTAEPDGTFKQYYLKCPPHMKTIDEAVAWTFELTEQQYLPALET